MNTMIITTKSAIFVFSLEGETIGDKDFMAMSCEAYQEARAAWIARGQADEFTAGNGVQVQVVER